MKDLFTGNQLVTPEDFDWNSKGLAQASGCTSSKLLTTMIWGGSCLKTIVFVDQGSSRGRIFCTVWENSARGNRSWTARENVYYRGRKFTILRANSIEDGDFFFFWLRRTNNSHEKEADWTRRERKNIWNPDETSCVESEMCLWTVTTSSLLESTKNATLPSSEYTAPLGALFWVFSCLAAIQEEVLSTFRGFK